MTVCTTVPSYLAGELRDSSRTNSEMARNVWTWQVSYRMKRSGSLKMLECN
jgi:hypothetical protein